MRSHQILIALLALLMAGCSPIPLGPGGGNLRSVPVAGPAQGRPDAPRLKRLPNGHYSVQRPWIVRLNGRQWKVQRGYTSNGITGPERVKKVIGDGVTHPETWAAVFHDWLFTQPGVSRAQADRMFYDLLIAYGVSPQKAGLMHTTVSAYSLSKAKP
jgi:hypothetical protein